MLKIRKNNKKTWKLSRPCHQEERLQACEKYLYYIYDLEQFIALEIDHLFHIALFKFQMFKLCSNTDTVKDEGLKA